MRRGTPREVAADVRRRVADLAPGGGYAFGSIHNIQAHVGPENIVAMFGEAREVGSYPIAPRRGGESARAPPRGLARWPDAILAS